MGFAAGLASWKRLLKPGGHIAVTEISWLTRDIPEEAREFWSKGYPAMSDVEKNLTTISSLGYTPISHFVIPESGWRDNYYAPLETRITEMAAQYMDSPEAREFRREQKKEIDLYRKYSASYGYVFYIATSPAP